MINLVAGYSYLKRSKDTQNTRIAMDYFNKAYSCFKTALLTWTNLSHPLLRAIFSGNNIIKEMEDMKQKIELYKAQSKDAKRPHILL